MLNLRELSEGLLVTVSLNRLVKKKEKKKEIYILCLVRIVRNKEIYFLLSILEKITLWLVGTKKSKFSNRRPSILILHSVYYYTLYIQFHL